MHQCQMAQFLLASLFTGPQVIDEHHRQPGLTRAGSPCNWSCQITYFLPITDC